MPEIVIELVAAVGVGYIVYQSHARVQPKKEEGGRGKDYLKEQQTTREEIRIH